MEPKMLRNFIERESEKVGFILANAIEEGAKIKHNPSVIAQRAIDVDGVRVYGNEDGSMSIVLRFENKTVAKAFEPSKDELAELADKKRKELAEIEQQLNERAQE